jgi:puromycin-sensitive aminopeptidase
MLLESDDSVNRRELLRELARRARFILSLPLTYAVISLSEPSETAATTLRPKGDEMNDDEPLGSSDPYRLPRHVIPTRYDLRLEPDLAAATFTGRVAITLTVKQETRTILFNATDLLIASNGIEGENGRKIDATVELEPTLQRARIVCHQTLAPGEWRLNLSFQGTLNDQLRGFYRSTYKDTSGTVRTLAATQFEATDARRAFPCWDEPDLKAVFSTTLVVDPQLTVISNTSVVSDSLEQGKKMVRFAETIKMSTYLVAFVVGQLQPTKPVFIGQTPLRMWTVPEKQHLTAFGQEIAVASLKFFENYYGIPYPGDKLDLVAIPDFASGAMENFGAITFRETALLVDPRAGTHSELGRVADVVSHENAHMWFGDLVTMSWWNGLWLNEAFATFMELLAVDAWKPEWKRWETFSVARTAAFSVDGLMNTRAIEYPVRVPKDAEAMFDVLTYEKGASVLRMLEQYIGPTVFRDGVRQYLRTHAYGNADTKDLWTAIGTVAQQPVSELMNGWIFQPGFPLVMAEVSGQELKLSQQRFTYLKQPQPSEELWHIPIQIHLTIGDRTEEQQILLTDREATVPLPSGVTALLINAGGHGFYRVHHRGPLLQQLLDQDHDWLAPIERFNLVSDAWATTVAGLMPFAEYLDLTTQFKCERDKNVWAVLLDSLSFLNRIITPDERPSLQALVRDRVTPAVNDLGWDPQPGESDLVRQLRGDLLGALGRKGNDPATQHQAVERYQLYRRDPSAVDPNIVPALVAILAYIGDEARYEEFSKLYRNASTPQEERRYLFSLTMFRSPDLLSRTLNRTLNSEIRTQDAPFVVAATMTSVHGRELAWEFVKKNWDQMDRLFPKQGLRRMCGGIVGLVRPELEQDVRAFFVSRKIDLGGKTLDQYLEQLRIAVKFREREGRTIQAKLANAIQS